MKITKNSTLREFLQVLGTEAIRDNLHENTWVNALMSDYKSTIVSVDRDDVKRRLNSEPTSPQNMWSKKTYPNWIITDTRFPNELQAVKDRNGICIKVNRKSVETGDTHPSETAWRGWNFDYVINNNGSVEQLVHEVGKMLIHFKLL